MTLTLHQIHDDRLSLRLPGDPSVAEPTGYLYHHALPKACIHPLTTPAGHCITAYRPSDHVWHRGLWFTIKYINRHNFWEENEPDFGVHRPAAEPRVELLDAAAARLWHELTWTSRTTGDVLTERRVLTFRAHEDGVRSIDWRCELTAAQDLELDRTPFTTWGGYGGMSLRATRAFHETSLLLPDGSTTEMIPGDAHPWVVMQGLMDGGPQQRVSIGLIDHPANPRSPSPFYVKCGGYNFMNAAFLFHEPMTVSRGQTLKFRYLLPYRDGVWSAAQFAAIADAYRAES